MRVTEFSQTCDLFLFVARHLLNRYREFLNNLSNHFFPSKMLQNGTLMYTPPEVTTVGPETKNRTHFRDS